MATQRRNRSSRSTSDLSNDGDNLVRITRLLALLVVKGESQPEKIRVLSGAGFTNQEIGELLGLTPNAVAIVLHKLRKAK